MSVTDRTAKAKASAMFGKITERDNQGRAKVVIVPGSECKVYQVIIRRFDNHITTECNCQTSIGNVPCKGNGQTVCYHSMAAVILASNEKDVEVSFCDRYDDAERLVNLGRKVTGIYVHGKAVDGKLLGVIWLSTRKPEVKAEPLSADDERRLAIRQEMYGEA